MIFEFFDKYLSFILIFLGSVSSLIGFFVSIWSASRTRKKYYDDILRLRAEREAKHHDN